jgi:hypothetical protein
LLRVVRRNEALRRLAPPGAFQQSDHVCLVDERSKCGCSEVSGRAIAAFRNREIVVPML